VSIWSVGLLGLLDGYLACAFLGVGIVIGKLFSAIVLVHGEVVANTV